jgi:hypothetical protein
MMSEEGEAGVPSGERLFLVDLPGHWNHITTKRGDARGKVTTLYRYGAGQRRCFFICEGGLRSHDLIWRVASMQIKQDIGGPVITVGGVVEAARAPRLSRHLWDKEHQRGKADEE